MTPDHARELLIEGLNFAAYKETNSSLHDSDKNRLYGSGHYNSDRPVHHPSPWAEGDFEQNMANLLSVAKLINRSTPGFSEALNVLQNEESTLGRIIRRSDPRLAPSR